MSIYSYFVQKRYALFGPRSNSIEGFAVDPAEASRLEHEADGELAKKFYTHKGRVIHKWLHYLDIYDRHFSTYKNTSVNMLEIGVFKGGSLELWRSYLGPDATIFGIDINPDCASYVSPPNQVRIGSQADPKFLREVAAEMGEIDIVLDDGSHVASHQMETFKVLFPLLKVGGLFVIEDLHTAYWPNFFEGGYKRKGTAIELVKQLIDDMHSWYHQEGSKTSAADLLGAIHVYDSMVVIEKRQVTEPRHIMVGTA